MEDCFIHTRAAATERHTLLAALGSRSSVLVAAVGVET